MPLAKPIRRIDLAKPLRVGVIGANPGGSWGSLAHLPALKALPEFEVTAVSTAHRETAEETARTFGIPHAFDDPRRLAEHPDVDVVSVVVRVPAHEELVGIALDAGKHVYCEWPLGRTTDEARALANAADAAGVVHMTGLQARRAPAILYLRDLLDEGVLGRVTAVQLTHSVPWSAAGRPGSKYLLDRDSGATFLTVPGGHSIDAICHVLGEFTQLRASLETLSTEAASYGFSRPSPDQAFISGKLASGVEAGLRLQGTSKHGTGMRLEIGGTEGDLVITSVAGGRGIQMADLAIHRATGTGRLESLEIPDRYFDLPESIRRNPPMNVAKSYRALHAAISSGNRPSPDFNDAVTRHRTIDAIQQSSDLGKTINL
jgi:predicted dehydrogenase